MHSFITYGIYFDWCIIKCFIYDTILRNKGNFISCSLTFCSSFSILVSKSGKNEFEGASPPTVPKGLNCSPTLGLSPEHHLSATLSCSGMGTFWSWWMHSYCTIDLCFKWGSEEILLPCFPPFFSIPVLFHWLPLHSLLIMFYQIIKTFIVKCKHWSQQESLNQ